jgi:hypothetical protein
VVTPTPVVVPEGVGGFIEVPVMPEFGVGGVPDELPEAGANVLGLSGLFSAAGAMSYMLLRRRK